MAEDIIMTLPVKSGPYWYHEHIWCYDDGTYSICDDDGNHEDLEENEVPTNEEHRNRWREYAAYVANTASDPLGEYLVKKDYRRKEVWAFKFSPWIGGGCLLEARNGARRYTCYHLSGLPQFVQDFLSLRHTNLSYLNDFTTWEEFEKAVPGVKKNVWWRHTFERKVPRDWNAYTRDLIRAARKAAKGGY